MRHTKRLIFLAALLVPFAISCTQPAPRMGGGDTPAMQQLLKSLPRRSKALAEADCCEKQNFSKQIAIDFAAQGAQVGSLPQGVTLDRQGNRLSFNIETDGVELVVSGTAHDAALAIDGSHPLKLTLRDAALECGGTFIESRLDEPLYLHCASSSSIAATSHGSEPDDTKKQALISTKGKIIFSGSGKLALATESGRAVDSDGALLIRQEATLAVTAPASDALRCKERLLVEGGDIAVTCSKEALQSRRGNVEIWNGRLALTTTGDKGHAIDAGDQLLVYGGSIAATVCGAASKCLKSDSTLILFDGSVALATTGGGLYSEPQGLSSSACIKSGADLLILSAQVSAASSGDGGRGIVSGGSLRMAGGAVSVTTEGGSYRNPADGRDSTSPKGVKSSGDMLIDGGSLSVVVSGVSDSGEGIESKKKLTIDGNARLYICAYDDAVNAQEIEINGGKLYAYSWCNDAVDANRTLAIHGGVVVANGTHSPEEGLDADFEGNFTLTGGTVFSIGGSMGGLPCIPGNRATTQASVAAGSQKFEKGSWLTLLSADGTPLLAYRLPRDLEDGAFLISTPQMQIGESYRVSIDGDYTPGQSDGGSLYTGGSYRGGSEVMQFELTTLLTTKGRDGQIAHAQPQAQAMGQGGFAPGPPPGMGGPGGAPGMGGGGPGGMMPPFGEIDRDGFAQFIKQISPDAKVPPQELFDAVKQGTLRPDTLFRYALADAFPGGFPPQGPGMGGPGGAPGMGGPGGMMPPPFGRAMGGEEIDTHNLPGEPWKR